MKIVIINASPRTDGLTSTLLKGISDTLSDKNVDVSYYDLGRLSMAQCLGCCACYKLGHCVIDDDAEKISCAIADADGLVLGTPTYASNVSGLMKVLIDRGHFVIEQLLMGKYCVTVATGENYGSKDAGKVLNRLVIYSGGRIPGKLVINAPFNIVTHDSNAIGKCRFLARRAGLGLYEAVIRKKRYPLQSLHHKIVFDLGIKPFVLSKGEKYSGVISRWNGETI
ncbi:MAG: flavodoxin family protein [Saccharofermentans sp.]|nr:flavodoxin family protein [Saccharofermentans sp.]